MAAGLQWSTAIVPWSVPGPSHDRRLWPWDRPVKQGVAGTSHPAPQACPHVLAYRRARRPLSPFRLLRMILMRPSAAIRSIASTTMFPPLTPNSEADGGTSPSASSGLGRTVARW